MLLHYTVTKTKNIVCEGSKPLMNIIASKKIVVRKQKNTEDTTNSRPEQVRDNSRAILVPSKPGPKKRKPKSISKNLVRPNGIS